MRKPCHWSAILLAALTAALLSPSIFVHAQADPPVPPAPPATQDSGLVLPPIRVTQPWTRLTTLTEDQRQSIHQIHERTLREEKALKAREEAQIIAVLTDEQKKELAQILLQEKVDKKIKSATHKKGKSTTQPAEEADNAAKPAPAEH